MRAYRQELNASYKSIVKPKYEKVIFFVAKDLAQRVLDHCKDERALYSVTGHSIGSRAHNCNTYGGRSFKKAWNRSLINLGWVFQNFS